MTTTSDHGQRYPLAAHLRAVTARAGYTIDPGELGPATGHHTDQVHAWVRAAARHAAATHMRNLLDDPIDFYRETTAHLPLDDIGHDVDLLADLVHRRDTLTGEQDHALTALGAACRALTGTGLLWPTGHQQSAISGHPAGGPSDELDQALAGLGFEPAAPAGEPTCVTYHHHGQAVVVAINDDGRVGVTGHDSGGTRVWTAAFDPGTPVPVIVAAVRAALLTDPGRPPAAAGSTHAAGPDAPPNAGGPSPGPVAGPLTGGASPLPMPGQPSDRQPKPGEQDPVPGSASTLRRSGQ